MTAVSLHVNTWDNAFHPPPLVKKLKDELGRFRTPTAGPVGFASPSEPFRVAAELVRHRRLTTGDPA
ncbi:hypothetical protein ACFYY8_13005 [Streptosporangium sp. NPDC001559]|uniref:hypothetical protein n=1 Tax=Streptosporangium sp. NPDC001559 TaxID=3366187 RepID=UPI0036F13CEF